MTEIFEFPRHTKYYYIAYNNTSGTPIYYDEYFQILKISKNEIVLKLPHKSCSLQHSLTFILSKTLELINIDSIPADINIKGTISITAKITESIPKKYYTETKASLTNYSSKEWNAIINFFIKNQTQSDKLVKTMRGYDK